MPFDEEELDPHGKCAAEIRRRRIIRLRTTLVETARILTLEQLHGLSEGSVHVLADLGLLDKRPVISDDRYGN